MGALIPLAISLAPEIGKWLFGSTGEQTAAAVAQVVQAATGTTDESVAQATISSNPQLAAQLRLQLAQIAAGQEEAARTAQLETMKAYLADIAGARQQTVDLAKSGSAVQWAPVVVSTVVLSTFGVVMFAALSHALPQGSETILNMLLGTLAAMATSVVAYWVGSSAGSAQKTDLLARSPAITGGKP